MISQEWPARTGKMLLALAVFGAALAVGAVHTVTLCIVTGTLSAATAFTWWNAEPMSPRPAATVLLLTGIGLTLFTVAQCIPLPLGWLAAIGAHNADVWSRTLAPLHETGPRWAPITLDPTATRIEVLRGVAYLTAFVTAVRIARTKDGVGFLAGVVILSGMVLALSAVIHPAFGVTRLFGMFEPSPGIAARHVAPLMNANNLAGYLSVSLCLALAATVSSQPRLPRPLMAAMVLLLGATNVWVASRAGVTTMVLGAIIVVAISRLPKSGDRRGVAILSVLTGVVAAIGAGLVVLGGWDDASVELFDKDMSKLDMVRHAMRMFPAVPWVGCGRGAFESAYFAFRTDPGYVTFTHPENFVAQWVLEWGLPVGAIAIGAIVFGLRPSALLARSSSAAGAWAALVALAVQNLGDLGTEVPGVVLAGVLCAAIVVGGTPGRRPRWRVERWSRHTRLVPAGGFAAALSAIVVAALDVRGELHADQRALYSEIGRQGATRDHFHDLVRASMLRHPAEPYLPFAAAIRAEDSRDENPVPWIGATIERASVYGPAHLLLARFLASRSAAQARLEYRLSVGQAPELTGTVVEEVPRLVNSYNDAVELVPEGPAGSMVIDELVPRLAGRLPASSVRLDHDLADRDAGARGPVGRGAELAAEDVEAGEGAVWCQGLLRGPCVADALQRARHYQAMAPTLCVGYEIEARIRMASGDPGALAALEFASDTVTDRVSCLESLARLAGQSGDATQEEKALAKVVAAGCATDDECADNLAWVADEEERRGSAGSAKALYERAHDRAPGRDGLLANIARLAAIQGLHAEAAVEYGKLARRYPSDKNWSEAEARERDAAGRALLRQ